MGVLTTIASVMSGAAAPVTEWVKGRSKLNEIRAEGKIRIEVAKQEATLQVIKQGAQVEQDYDMKVLDNQNGSWKDELLTLVFTFPFILSFMAPFIDAWSGMDIQKGVSEAWSTVALAPAWYQWVVIGIVSATFGLRWLFARSNPLTNKKGPSPEKG